MYTLASKFGANVYIILQFTLATTGLIEKNRKSASFSLQYFEIPLGNVTMVYIYTADIQVMRATRWIVLQLLPEVHYKLGFFEGIVKSGKTNRQISLMIFKVALKQFCMLL